MPTHYVGVDFHKSTSYLSVMNEFGTQVKSGRISNKREDLEAFLRPYPHAAAVLEAGRNWSYMYDWLEALCERVALAHPLKVKAIASAKVKTDKIDSRVLAHLLRAGLIPMAHVPKEPTREVREILRQRMFFVRLGTMAKNRIHTTIDRHPELPVAPTKNIFAPASRPWFKSLPLSELERASLEQDLKLLDALKERIHESDGIVLKIFKTNEDARLLQSMPGFGVFLATLVASEIDGVGRFPDPKKLAAYAGLVPSTYSSGPKTRHGGITKQGNKFLRWAFVEAIWPAIRKDPNLRQYYQRIKLRKGSNPAKVATARYLLTIAYHLLRDKRAYEPRPLPPPKASAQASA
ncbi:MAG: IS110 family transposase [Terriglobales bacterium]